MYSMLANIMMLLDAEQAARKAVEIIKTMVGPVLVVLAGAGAIYMVVMGVQYAKAEDDGKRQEVKKRLLNLAIGVIAVMTLGALCIGLNWQGFTRTLFGAIWGVSKQLIIKIVQFYTIFFLKLKNEKMGLCQSAK